MKKLLQTHKGLFFILILVYLTVLLIYGYWNYIDNRNNLMAAIDKELYRSAATLKYILPEDFHDRATDPDAISIEEDRRIADKLTRLIRETGFKYAYTVVKQKGSLFFAASDIAADPETKRGTFYFYRYEDADESFYKAFEQNTPTYKTVSDKWGTVRTVMVPEISKSGVKYLACADYDISHVNEVLYKNLLKSLATILFFLILGVPIVIVYKKLHWEYSKSLQQSEERFRTLVEESPLGISLIGKNGSYKYINPQFQKIFGYTIADIPTGKDWFAAAFPDQEYRQNVVNIWCKEHQQTEIGQARPREFTVTCKDGSKKEINFRQVTMENLDQLVIYEDITERVRNEEIMRLSHQRFTAVLDSIDATIYVADMETHEIYFMNKNMIKTFGGDHTGQLCYKVFRKESVPCRHCTNDQLVDDNGQPTGVVVWQGQNPVTGRWYINYDRAIEWTDGQIVKLQIATEITEYKKMEDALRNAQKMEAIGTLASGIAHDFNNLLMGIQGRISLISMDLDPDHPHAEHTAAIEEHIKSAASLTNQLIGMVRGGKYDVKPFDINELLKSTAEMFSRTRKQIRIQIRTTPEPAVVNADKRQIEQVLLNIYVNAWQAMPDGGHLRLESDIVTLDLEESRNNHIPQGTYVKLSLSDSGTGMTEETRQKVFDPFFTTKEKGRGTGLGLASAYGIVRNHGGTITADSEVGQGSTFNIYLPRSRKNFIPVRQQTDEPVGGTETILLVDDEAMILEVGKAMLGRLGYRVVTADSGETAIASVSEIGPDLHLVILDLIMPGVDGGKTFDRIREINPTVPVILSSGYSIKGQATEIMKRGCDAFIQKPFGFSELSKKIREVLENRKNQAQRKLSDY